MQYLVQNDGMHSSILGFSKERWYQVDEIWVKRGARPGVKGRDLVQKTVYLHLRKALQTSIVPDLTRRIRRWGVLGIQGESDAVDLVKSVRHLPAGTGPRVRWVAVRLLFNGWHMGRRFQRFAPCSFCEQFCQEQGIEDSIEHMVTCRRLVVEHWSELS